MLWLKSFHIVAMVAWFAGIFYLPRLFVYHADIEKESEPKAYDRFCIMERRLFWGIMTPSAVITLLLGFGLVHTMRLSFSHPPSWLAWKLALVALLVGYHIYCGVVVRKFKLHQNRHSARFYRIMNELPVLALVAIVLLVVLKPM